MEREEVLGDATVSTFVPTLFRDAARAFYEETLGLRLVNETPFALLFEVNGTPLRVTTVQELDPQPFTLLGFDVADILGTALALAERGVVFERYDGFDQDPRGIWHAPGGDKVAWFRDPDGNLLSISSRAA